jgi:dsDNA-binding SOS-regulon protein
MNPGQTWDYQGFTVWEGLRPGETDRWQYFFVVSREGEKKFTYCVWVEKQEWLTRMNMETESEEEILKKAVPLMREKGIDRVKEKITNQDFTSVVLKLEGQKSEEIQLDTLEEKLT